MNEGLQRTRCQRGQDRRDAVVGADVRDYANGVIAADRDCFVDQMCSTSDAEHMRSSFAHHERNRSSNAAPGTRHHY
jgi:hypothetical protein